MSFAVEWLSLREPADRAGRDAELLARAAAAAVEAAGASVPVIVDLGCGTGATVRALGPLLPSGGAWRLVDHDARLLALAEGGLRGRARAYRLDLSALDLLPLEGAHLVTASALLDLMTPAWVAALAERLKAAGVGFYAALSFDGTLAWDPAVRGDAAVARAFRRHQRGDKGLGPALGPEAGAQTARAFSMHGFRVFRQPSPWRLGAEQAELQRELVTGIASAAAEAGCREALAWGQARRAACGYSTCVVGHVDLLALPPRAPNSQSNRMSEPSP